MTPLRFLAAALVAGSLSAQQYIETFTFPDGPVVPGWTQQGNTWVIQNRIRGC